MTPKLFVGPVSKNTVDATIEFVKATQCPLGLIPSRRQVDYNGGYVGWTTKTLVDYVHSKTDLILLERDHGGPAQGQRMDRGITSFNTDARVMDVIHIDPWKQYKDLQAGINCTIMWIKELSQTHPTLQFEIGTEQSIFPYSSGDLEMLIYRIIKECDPDRIKYVVIQSGTSLQGNTNTGTYDENKLWRMLDVVKAHGFLSKEHNGDYLPTEQIRRKFELGLDAINIAPEFGMIESDCYIQAIKTYDIKLIDKLHAICYDSKKWMKWVGPDFDFSDKESLIKICGHYVLNTPRFIKEVARKLPVLHMTIKNRIKKRMAEICL